MRFQPTSSSGFTSERRYAERVLHLAPVVELRAADDAVRNTGAHERLFDDAALGVGAVEDGGVAEAHTFRVGEPVDLVHDEGGFIVLVLGVVANDQLATDLLGPEVLRAPRRVVRDHRVGRVEDPLRGPVVLVEDDHRRLGKRLLEPHEVPEVSPAEAVHRVVRDDAAGHEVVGLLDVEVVDLRIEIDLLDTLDPFERPVLVHHHHAGLDRRRGCERQVGVGGAAAASRRESSRVLDVDGEDRADLLHRLGNLRHVCAGRLEPPVGVAPLGTDGETQLLLEGAAALLVTAEQLDPMERASATLLVAQRDHHPGPAQRRDPRALVSA